MDSVGTPEPAESIFAKRQRQRRENYFEGHARAAYRFQESLEQSFSSTSTSSESSSTQADGRRDCTRHCTQALASLKAAFAAIGQHPAKVLQNRVASYPNPKKQKLAHQNITGIMRYYYRIKNQSFEQRCNFFCTAQNKWLRHNVLDAHGNFLFCEDYIVACLDVHTERLHKQRIIKRKQKQQPIVEMTKGEVSEKRLESYVLHGDDEDLLTFAVWWRTLDDDQEVEVQYPHERHGLAGRYRISSYRCVGE